MVRITVTLALIALAIMNLAQSQKEYDIDYGETKRSGHRPVDYYFTKLGSLPTLKVQIPSDKKRLQRMMLNFGKELLNENGLTRMRLWFIEWKYLLYYYIIMNVLSRALLMISFFTKTLLLCNEKLNQSLLEELLWHKIKNITAMLA